MSGKDVAGYLARAEELLKVAKANLEGGFMADSVSRSYYAMFHAATAVLLSLGVERNSHKGLIAAFSEHVVRKGLMDNRFHANFHKAYEARSEDDYLPLPGETPERAGYIHEKAIEFVAACRAFLEGDGSGNNSTNQA